MEFECKQCDKKYKSYQSLWNHNKKFHTGDNNIKIIDESLLKYVCKFCNKKFDKKQKKCYHQKKCEAKDAIIQHIDNKIIPIETTTITNNTNSNINSNNKTTIIINNYNNDNLSYISEQFKERLFNNLLKRSDHIIPLPKLIENIKFNPNHKENIIFFLNKKNMSLSQQKDSQSEFFVDENNNVKITSDRSKIGLYYDHDKWKAINKNQLLDDMCDYSLKIFKQYFEEKKDELSENIVMQFASFSHIAELKSKLRQEIKDKIENIAYIFTKNNEDELDL
jgi:hypothetical protein